MLIGSICLLEFRTGDPKEIQNGTKNRCFVGMIYLCGYLNKKLAN
jgi:hypothetical protein